MNRIAMFLSAVCCWLAVWAAPQSQGQTIPYGLVHALFDSAEKVASVKGVEFNIRMNHSDPADKRRVTVVVDGPGGRQKVDLRADGTFRLPDVPVEEHATTVIRHNLEAGAMELSFLLNLSGTLEVAGNATIQQQAQFLVEGFQKIDAVVWKQLGTVIPVFADFRLSLSGVILVRKEPGVGRALLKKGGETVMSIDLSEPGAVTLPFARFDPETHHLEFVDGADEGKQVMNFEFVVGDAAIDSVNAIQILPKAR